MLQFYYDCLDKYVDRSDFQYIEMDTDSAYLALSGAKLDDVIKPHMKEEYERDKYNWFPNETTKELKAYNKRTPGLFKVDLKVTLCTPYVPSCILSKVRLKASIHARVSKRTRTKSTKIGFITCYSMM